MVACVSTLLTVTRVSASHNLPPTEPHEEDNYCVCVLKEVAHVAASSSSPSEFCRREVGWVEIFIWKGEKREGKLSRCGCNR